MTALGRFFGSPLMKPVGWTLVQFLWQGAVAAALLFGVLLLLRRASAHARYLAACFAFLIMAASPVITLTFLLGRPDPVISLRSHHTDAVPIPPGGRTAPAADRFYPLPGTLLQPAKKSGTTLRLIGVASHSPQILEPALPGLVATWLIGIALLCLRLLGGWAVVRRLARRETRPVEAWLRERAEELARRLGLRQPVELLESVRVEVPTVIGCLRAVILVPASALTGLSPQQLEALLAHELAHVRRHDYLVNLIQTTVETLLFYHPAVWWVSHRIRAERENCCDDVAVAAIGDRLTYARALAALEELRAVPDRLALAGSGGDLLSRIRRILGLPSTQEDEAPAWLAGAILLPLLLAAAAMPHASTSIESHPGAQGGGATTPTVSSRRVETPSDGPAWRPSLTVRHAAAPPRMLPGDTSPFRIARQPAQSQPRRRATAARPIPAPPNDASWADSRQPERAPTRARPALSRAADAAPARLGSADSLPQSMDLAGVDLSVAELKGMDLAGVSFRGARLLAVDLSGRDLTGKDLSHAELSGANLTGARLAGADLTEANLSGADLTKADLSHCKMTGANFSGASLHGTRLAGVALSQANLSGADLKELELKEVRLAGAALAGVDLAGWDLSRQDLSRVDLSGANLTGTRLAGAVLTDANLSAADLTDTDLSRARMSGANFSGARLHGTRLVGVDLAHVNLSGADLSGLKLTGVDLAGVRLPAVKLAGRNLTGGFP